jgi:hypothetical protein
MEFRSTKDTNYFFKENSNAINGNPVNNGSPGPASTYSTSFNYRGKSASNGS